MIRLERLAFWFDLAVSSVKLADKRRNRNSSFFFLRKSLVGFPAEIPCFALTGQDTAYTTVIDCTLGLLA